LLPNAAAGKVIRPKVRKAEMSSVHDATRLAQRGLKVFRLKRGTKNHYIDRDWAKDGATADLVDVFDKFSGASYNIGVRTDGHIVLDIDAAKGGYESLATLGPLPDTLRTATARGGVHIYLKAPDGKEFSGSVEKIAKGIDIRARGNYVVGPGSEFDGGAYRIEHDAPIAVAPQWLVDLLEAAPQKAANAGQALGELDTPHAIASARAYLETAPVAIEGQGGDLQTYEVACRVMDWAISPETCFDLMAEIYNPRCEPEWELEDLQAKVDSAARNRQEAIGSKDAAAGFEPATLPPPEPLKPARTPLLEFGRDVSLQEIIAHQANAIVKGLAGPKESGTIFGTSGEGKSFIAIDFGFHVAHGLPYLGRKVKRTPVLYVALEGVPGFRKRMLAAVAQFGDAGDYFARLDVPYVSLAKNEDGAAGAKLIAEQALYLRERVGADTCLIVIDTKARATAGDDENSASDMSLYAEKRVGYLMQHTNAFVLTVHHAGKTGTFRGSTAQVGAEDLVLRVEGGQVIADKVKDDVQGPLFDFKLKQVTLGKDDEDVPVTTCVVQKSPPTISAEGEKRAKPKPEPKPVRIMREALSRVAAEYRDKFVHPRTGEVLQAAPVLAVREAFYSTYEGQATTIRKAWDRAFEKAPNELRVETIRGTKIMWLEAADFAAH
jgi:hypothetical protein